MLFPEPTFTTPEVATHFELPGMPLAARTVKLTQLKQWRWHADFCADAVNRSCRDSGTTAEPLPEAGITTKPRRGFLLFSPKIEAKGSCSLTQLY